ncbi:MAG: DUF2058 family protein, partial [Candidatus Eisenbacteria sp.]|nr:DUF2058 family protein [Candidatus Eisenbacteria bacterium]
MADMRDALRKAGLASDKKLRQTKHQDRIRRKELGEAGIESERRQKEKEYQEELARKKIEDQAREEALRSDKKVASKQTRIDNLLRDGDLMAREAGNKRFYFATADGHIFFLDVAPLLAKRLAQGDAAIVRVEGA